MPVKIVFSGLHESRFVHFTDSADIFRLWSEWKNFLQSDINSKFKDGNYSITEGY